MKKFYFLIPIIMWGLALPIWNFASQFIKPEVDASGVWWIITCMLWGALCIVSIFWASDLQS